MRIIKDGNDVLDRSECAVINCCDGAKGAFPQDIEAELYAFPLDFALIRLLKIGQPYSLMFTT